MALAAPPGIELRGLQHRAGLVLALGIHEGDDVLRADFHQPHAHRRRNARGVLNPFQNADVEAPWSAFTNASTPCMKSRFPSPHYS
jgi:hypothetical protein